MATHSHSHSHSHSHAGHINQLNLLIALILNLGITAIEFVGGALSGSLALTSDAFHNLSDAFSIFNSLIAYKIGRKHATNNKTFGFKRVEVLSALLNSLILVGVSIYVVVEAYNRIRNPYAINSDMMLGVGIFGLIGNFVSVMLLHRDAKHSLNIKASYIHLLGDVLSSVAVIVGAILIRIYHIYGVDAYLSIGIVCVILFNAVKIIYDTTEILMQGAPKGIKVEKLKADIEQIEAIENIHHLHIWRLSDTQWYLECHVSLKNDILLSKTTAIKHEIKKIVKGKYHFTHVTLQLEYGECENSNIIEKGCK